MKDIELIHGDGLQALKGYVDNHFDIAIVDPPYGYEHKTTRKETAVNSGNKFAMRYVGKEWNKEVPEKEYWQQLFRVSKNQIVCGGNYFTNYLPISRGWVYWHKQGEKMSSVNDELIWTSFDVQMKMFSRCHGMDKGFLSDHKVFHPTTKPTALYKWLLHNYTSEGDLILDTHLGSGSIAIACHQMKRKLIAYEIDAEYYKKACKRFKQQTAQQALW